MSEVKLMVFYPQPTDTAQFENDYKAHLSLFHQKANVPEDSRPYTVTRFLPSAEGPAPFFQLFSMPFPSAEAVQEAMSSPEMQEVAADAVRISSGGEPLVLVGREGL